jgi:hypothetical protein
VKNCRELVELMLEFLDGLEEDPDLEPSLAIYSSSGSCVDGEEQGDDEQSLGSLDRMADQTKWAAGSASYDLLSVDAEQDDSDDEDGADDSPSLGSGNDPHGSGTSYFFDRARDGSLDCEGDEHDGREPDIDEPSLGSTGTINQEAWAFGALAADLEQGTTRRFREEPKPVSTCNVTMLDGSKVKVD